ncbi:MAG TPA: SAM-dependent methyltransferase [Pyrinomonadaceae bacterium]|nr:SAM-dependent methyltransferase [Pyrinomonadaceae bacterium]
MSKKKSFDIALTGIGIGGFEQTTLQTIDAFKRARIIFHLTSYHQRLKKYCANVVDLDKEYWTGEVDSEVYPRMANIVLDEAKKGPGVVMVGDGHPAYYDDVTWDIYRRGKRRGLDVRILPAISSIDSLAANCGLEINTGGFQIFDATTIVAINQDLNPQIDTLIMQIGWFGTSLVADITHSKRGRFKPLVDYLHRFYPADHRVRVMSAPYSAGDAPVVISTKLESLDQHHKRIMPIMSMFVPALPANESAQNEEFIQATVDIEHLKEVALM